jgi:hypothetical protein
VSIRAVRPWPSVWPFAWTLVLMLGGGGFGCDAGAAKDKARDKAKEIGEQAADKGKSIAHDLGDAAKDKAGAMWESGSGELSDAAHGIFAKGAEASEGGVEALLAKGEQLAPVAFDIGKTLHGFVDSDTRIEPIVQDLDDPDAQAELDARIQDMPRVETIDGVDVGFKDVSQWDAGGRASESAYLVLWRRDNRLIGFVYRSNKRLHMDKVVAETPRLLALVKGAL